MPDSPQDVQDLYEAGSTLLRLPLDDAPGATEFADALGQHDGACSGAACPPPACRAARKWRCALTAQTTPSPINDANTGDVQNLTLAAWVELNSPPSPDHALCHGGPRKGRAALPKLIDLHFYIKSSSGAFYQIRPGVTLTTGAWYHVAGSYDGQAMRLYLNGSEVGTRAVSVTLVGGATVRLEPSQRDAGRLPG